MAGNVNPATGTVTDDLNNAWSYIVAQCTRFVAGALSWIPAGLGNAYQWFDNARAKGLSVIGPTLSPPVGSVAVWGPTLPGSGGYGHVAEVIGNGPNGFMVAEENYSGGPGVTDTRTVTTTAHLTGFILKPGDIPVVGGALNAVGDIGSAAGNIGSGLAGLADALNPAKALANLGKAITGKSNLGDFFLRAALILGGIFLLFLALFILVQSNPQIQEGEGRIAGGAIEAA